MKSFWAPSLLVLAASVTLSCGSGNSNSGRQLQSITVVQVQNGSQFQFIATGTFSAPPTTVMPLPVDWTNGLMAPPPPTYNYTLSTQPYVYNCDGSGLIQVVAFAPPNPDAPSSGSVSQVVQGVATFTCP
jgi:hypothetical protein